MTTYQVYSDASDDYILSGDTTTYSSARAGTGDAGVAYGGSGTEGFAGQGGPSSASGAGLYAVFEMFIAFDTSAVPAGAASNVSVTLTLSAGSFVPSTSKTFEIRETDWDPADASTSFVPGASVAGKTLVGSAAIGPASTGAIAFTSALTTIPRATFYEVFVVGQDTRTNTTPGASGDHTAAFYEGDQGATNAPMLQFDVGAGAATSFPPIPPIRRYLGNLGR